MTVIVQEPLLSEDERIQGESSQHEKDNDHTGSENSLQLDGGFVTPDSNAFGHAFREYRKESERQMSVEAFYRTNHINQTYEFALSKREQHGRLDKCVMSIWECCELLNEYVDESDPDLDEPQIEHLLQTAEAIRRDYPNEDWLHLTGLIHDLGKVLLHPRFGGEPQWAVVGDTYPLGCAFDESIVHHEHFLENPDYHNPKYNNKYGIYSEKCGLENVIMSWGHDEYMYTVGVSTLYIVHVNFFLNFYKQNILYWNNFDCVENRSLKITTPVCLDRLCSSSDFTLSMVIIIIIIVAITDIKNYVYTDSFTKWSADDKLVTLTALHRAGAYTYLMSAEDEEMLEWVKKFNKYDLYSKSKVRIDVDAVKPYYLSLIEKYFPSKLRW